jgi:hypothetical protein
VGAVQAHHLVLKGEKGMGTKTPDAWAIPLCGAHHADLHSFAGPFFECKNALRARWQVEMALTYCPDSAKPKLEELRARLAPPAAP